MAPPLVRMLNKHPHRMVLVAIVCVSLAETVMTSSRYGGELTTAHWVRVNEALRADAALVVGTSWLAPEARMRLDAAATPEASGRPDLRGVTSFDVLLHHREGPSAASRWRPSLSPDSRPRRVSLERAGPLLVEHWRVERPERIVDTLVHPHALQVKVNRDVERSCRGDPRSGYTCPGLRGAATAVKQQYAEVYFEARRCLSMQLPSAASLSLFRANFERGDRIVGHLGFEDFNARLRNDGPVTMTIQVEGETVARSTFTNADGWAGFEFSTTPGVGALSVSLDANAPGQWGSPPERYERGATRRVCLELRSMREGDPA